VRKADKLTTLMCPVSWNMGASGPVQACNGTALPLPFYW